MKISEMINNLQDFMCTYGNLDCYYAVDDEGNAYHEVYYTPSHYYINQHGDVYQEADLEDEDLDDIAGLKQICIVN